MTKAKIAAAAMPGSAIGSTTRRNAAGPEQPNTQAASSSSRGIAWNRLAEISTANGMASTLCISPTPSGVSYSPSRMKPTASGSARIATGKARVSSTNSRNAVAPRNR